MKKMLTKIKLVSDEKYRPKEIIVDGEIYSTTAFLAKHGYYWATSASGNILYYRSESGKEFSIHQKTLTTL